MKNNFRLLILSALAIVLVLITTFSPTVVSEVSSQGPKLGNRVLDRALKMELGQVKAAKWEQRLSSGVTYTLLQSSGELDRRANGVKQAPVKLPLPSASSSALATQGCQNVFPGGAGIPDNIRVNQDCSLRRQAEEVIAVNPTMGGNLIAGQNDSRVGFNHCGYDWSFDNGKTWGDQIPPFYQRQALDGHTYDACSDPTATFDANGNAYVGGVVFDVSFAASAFVVSKSNAPIGGAFFHTPDSTLSFQTYRDNPLGVVAEDNNPNIFHDKEFIVADHTSGSPKANNVYATWTRFDFATGFGVGGHSPIYFSQSTNGGRTWSSGIEISGVNATYCTIFSGESNANACDQDQGSDPVVGADGTIYVTFGNGNTPLAGINQYFLVRCPDIGGTPGTTDCSVAGNWSAPKFISDMQSGEPFGPVGSSGCPGGRQCLPPNGYRLDDFITGSVNVDSSGKLYFAWSDYRNGGGSCPFNGVAATSTPPCNDDVFYKSSTDGGATWSALHLVTPLSKFGPTGQWMPWSAVTGHSEKYFIAFYDRGYGHCEFLGCNDITLATITNASSASPTYSYQRITTSSMPNLVVANNPLEAGFLGDYMWVTVSGNSPLIVWADTRGLNGTVEEDIYYATIQ